MPKNPARCPFQKMGFQQWVLAHADEMGLGHRFFFLQNIPLSHGCFPLPKFKFSRSLCSPNFVANPPAIPHRFRF
jgi:hypothetical protein